MDFSLSETEEMLKNMAREFLITECPSSYVRQMEDDDRGFTPDIWQKIADVGWLGLPFPEQYGGGDASFLELCILLEEMGRACLPSPYFSTIVLGGLTILDAGTDQQKQYFLPPIARGKLIITMIPIAGVTENTSTLHASSSKEQDSYVLNGTAMFVPDAVSADYILCPTSIDRNADHDDRLTIFIVDRTSTGLTIEPLHTIASDKLCRVTFKDVSVTLKDILGGLGNGCKVTRKAEERAAIGKCCEMVGGAQKVLEMTVDYAKERVQFGRPIGNFQAIQHHCADMATDVDSSRFITYQAAWMLSRGLPCTRETSIAKAWTSDAHRRCCKLGHQIHGAIGFTRDHDMQLYLRRAKAAELAFGDAQLHRDIVAQHLYP